jgi:hypothetical protein
MQVSDIREAAQQRLGRPLPRSTLKASLAAGVRGDPQRFRRTRYSVYELMEQRAEAS